MKILMKPIEVIAWFNIDGMPTPLKFRIEEPHGLPAIIKIEHISYRAEDKLAGNKMMTFRCQSTINSSLKLFELRFEPGTGKWFLYKF